MNTKQKVIQLIGDLAIPVLGFYFWNWNIYFILLFFCLDMVGGEIALYLKARKIKEVQGIDQAKYGKTFSFISLLVLALNIFFIHIGMFLYEESFQLWNEIHAFLSYTEMGIQQGYVLIPLIAMMAYTQYKVEFLLPRKFLTIRLKELYKRSLQLKFAVLLFTSLMIVVASALQPSQQVLLWVILLPVSFVNWINKD